MNEKLETKVETLRPFTRFLITIGELPTSYLMSMTYYEQILWFTKYLQEKVIPAVNNNAEAVKEIQDFLNNLDLQDEVNNKLDEMAESGQLTDIIAQYLGLAGMITFDTVADMKLAENLVNGSKCTTLGFYNVNDGGGATYKVRTITNDDVVDEQFIIALYDDNLIAEYVHVGAYNIKTLGCKGDNTFDNTTLLQNIINKCDSIYIPNGKYLITSTLTISRAIQIEGENSNGLSDYLGEGNTLLCYNGNSTAINCTTSGQYFVRLTLRNFGIKCTGNGNGTGILVHNFNHFYFEKLSIMDFTQGTAIQVGNNTAFGCQYGSIKGCLFEMDLIGVSIYQSNGIIMENNYFDCNNNGSWIYQYTHGYPENSIAINIVSGASNVSNDNLIQGFEKGVVVSSGFNKITNTRCEMVYKGFVINGNSNVLGDGCENTNYLLLDVNGLPATGRYGYIAEINGNGNIIGDLFYGSCIGIQDNGTNNTAGQKIDLYIPEIKDTMHISLMTNHYLNYKACYIKYFKISAANMADVKAAGYANRWVIATNDGYIGTDSIPDASITGLQTVKENGASALREILCWFTKQSENAVPLKDVRVTVYLLPW